MNEYCNEMWQRLEERFGYEGKIVEVLLNGIMHYQSLLEKEERRVFIFNVFFLRKLICN